jgi:hypothetical protein
VDTCYMFRQYFAPNSDVGLLMGYVLYRLLIELESMDLDTFSH